MSSNECIICSEEITATTGRAVLGCGHEFHMMCVTRWFCRQEGASSCPCCRRESGQYDDVPHAAEDNDGEEESDDDESVSGWSDDDGSLVSVEEYWERKAEGTWHQKFRETVTGRTWNPGAADDIPPALAVGASMLQALWRGHVVRRNQVVDALLSLKNVVHVTAPLTSDPVP